MIESALDRLARVLGEHYDDGNLCVSITATRDLMFGMSDADEAALKEVVARLAKRGGAL